MPDPIHIERLFQELLQDLEETVSTRHAFTLIRTFIGELSGDYRRFDSYLLQLAEEIPCYGKSVTYSGLDPERIENDLVLFDRIAASVPEIAENNSYKNGIGRYREVCIIQFACVGEAGKTYTHLSRWLQCEPELWNESLQSIKRMNENEQGFLQAFIHQLDSAIERRSDFTDEQRKKIKRLCLELRELAECGPDSLFIPARECYKSKSGEETEYGRLRKISVRLTGRLEGNRDQLTRRFNVIGAEESSWVEAGRITDAARKLFSSNEQKTPADNYKGDVYYEINNAIHDGNSANSAIALLWYSGLQRFSRMRERYAPAPGICITGDIDENGNLKEVYSESIRAKSEAAFFSGVSRMIVPGQQEVFFQKELQKLEKRYPNREINMFGIKNVKELYYDRRLTIYHNPSRIRHGLQKAWEKKFETTGIITILILMVVIGRLVYGPLDSNPALFAFTGEVLQIQNSAGTTLEEIHVGKLTSIQSKRYTASRLAALADADKDGMNDIIWAEVDSEGSSKGKGGVYAKKLNGSQFLWSQPLLYPLNFPEKPEIFVNDYHANKLLVDDLKGNSSLNLLLSASHLEYFPSVLSLRDLETGRELSHFVNTGYILDFEAAVLDDSGVKRIIIAGVNNAFNTAFLGVLDTDYLDGASPATDEYRIDGYNVPENLDYVLLPRTIVAKNVVSHQDYNSAVDIQIMEEVEIIQLRVFDFSQYDGNELQIPANRAYLYYYFNYDLTLKAIGTSDGYDVSADILHKNDLIDEVPDYRYFEEYKKELLYWDGEGFVSYEEDSGID